MKSQPLSLESLKALLKAQPHYLDQEGELNTALLFKLAQQCQRNLLELLFDNSATRQAFFFEHEGHSVFVRDHFIDYIQHKRFVANSYTAYRNKIGLHDEHDYLKKSQDVVLAFPFKDCVLEGGQTKDDAKRSERYYHRILAIEQLDRLLDPKVLTNARRYTKEGPSECKDFHRNNSNHTISDNLIIKGNNLIALHTIKEQFAKKVKLIYIDPPYNTGNDSFHYNDNFNHSTWLVFMKNRLEAARELLRDDGVIFVQCDDNEQAYLKVLMDEVFGRENFVGTLIWKKKAGGSNNAKQLAIEHEYLLIYCKDKSNIQEWFLDFDSNYLKRYCEEDEKGKYFWDTLLRNTGSGKQYAIEAPDGTIIEYDKNGNKKRWLWAKETFDIKLKQGEVGFKKLVGNNEWSVRFKQRLNEGKKPRSLLLDKGTTSDGTNELKLLFDVQYIFDNPKPEKLINTILQIATKENDIVLDFCLGSGTTAAVAHKMGRQYIGIEQMDYIQTIAVERLAKVIAGEQGGISKSVGWAGGGSFVYLELKPHNQNFIERIAESTTKEQLLQIQQELLQNLDLDYRLNTEAVQQNPEDFAALSLDDQRQILIDFLELNQLYVPYSERKDTRFACTDKEIKLSESFYRGGKA